MSSVHQKSSGVGAEVGRLSRDAVGALPGSSKIHRRGSHPGIRVAMREIIQSDTRTGAAREKNPKIVVYDTSGPYTDESAEIDLQLGLPALRADWIERRGDTRHREAESPEAACSRPGIGFPMRRNRRQARSGRNVTQMHYARRGIITDEMEYVAIRENLNLQELYDTEAYRVLL